MNTLMPTAMPTEAPVNMPANDRTVLAFTRLTPGRDVWSLDETDTGYVIRRNGSRWVDLHPTTRGDGGWYGIGRPVWQTPGRALFAEMRAVVVTGA